MADPDSVELRRLAEHIRAEVQRIEELVVHLASSVELLRGSPSVYEANGAAAILENFYSTVENILKRIATTFEGVPGGDSWHKDLLEQVSRDTPQRPQVISKGCAAGLESYLGFRHLRRNLYLPNLDVSRFLPLVERCRSVWELVRAEIGAFAEVVDEMASVLLEEH